MVAGMAKGVGMGQGEAADRKAREPAWWLRNGARVVLAVWASFWVWFVVSVAISEGSSSYPYAGGIFAGVVATALVPWWWPRIGTVLALVFAGVAFWFFRGASAYVLFAGVPAAAGLAMAAAWVIGARRRV